MAFEPDKITREHINAAIQKITSKQIELIPSTKWDVIIEGNPYPPKEVMRQAHYEMNGEHLWKLSGGEPTNKWLRNLGLEIKLKLKEDDPVQKMIDRYKQTIAQTELKDEKYKWELISKFKGKPNVDAENFADELKAIDYRNLMYHTAKAVVNQFLEMRPKEFKAALRTLFDESIELEKRIKTFDESLLKNYREMYPSGTNSHHQDERTMATYLTYFNPDKYTFYKSTFYSRYCKLLKLAPAKKNRKYIHYLKLIEELIEEYIIHDSELLNLVKKFIPADLNPLNYRLIAQDILYVMLEKNYQEKTSDTTNNLNEPPSSNYLPMISMPLNSILFGPPGTGKTYNAINHAVSIIEDKSVHSVQDEDHDEVLQRYNLYRDNGRIEFTSFHQSMSYEDFIEGIKPIMGEEETGDVRYEIRDGIFKDIVNSAKTSKDFQKSKAQNIVLPPEKLNKQINKISLGNSTLQDDQAIYKYCMDNNCIALGYGASIDFSGVTSKKDIRARFRDAGEDFMNKSDFSVSAMERFILWMKPGQLVFIPNGNTKLSAIGELVGDYYFDDSNENIRYNQFRKVKWLYKNLELPIQEIYKRRFSQQSIYQIDPNDDIKAYFKSPEKKSATQNHVLIIDEINRGNIAQIFGELITLLEPNKRQGEAEALETILPYSKSRFSVPNNLYIIGTMNTADRSVEALDTALRRRFSFIEMAPKAGIIQTVSKYSGKLDLVQILTAINARVEKLLDKDHCIGHSYFLDITNDEQLKQVFTDKVIPLLEEYFFGDLARIGMVLGESFIKESEQSNTYNLKYFQGMGDGILEDLSEKKVYRITNSENWKFQDIYEK